VVNRGSLLQGRISRLGRKMVYLENEFVLAVDRQEGTRAKELALLRDALATRRSTLQRELWALRTRGTA
jgi:hypothetical protein